MTPINLEMIKQLLQEFVDKEAVTAAEITVVQQQVKELEARITECKDKLAVISRDKEKLLAMAQRYAAGAALFNRTNPKPTQLMEQAKILAQSSASNPLQNLDAQVQTARDPLAPQWQSQNQKNQNKINETITGDHPAVPAPAVPAPAVPAPAIPAPAVPAPAIPAPAVPAPASLNFQASHTFDSEQAESPQISDETGHSMTETRPKAEQEKMPTPGESESRQSLEGEEPTEDQKDGSNKKADSLKESVDDTVKSINDALRGLFR